MANCSPNPKYYRVSKEIINKTNIDSGLESDKLIQMWGHIHTVHGAPEYITTAVDGIKNLYNNELKAIITPQLSESTNIYKDNNNEYNKFFNLNSRNYGTYVFENSYIKCIKSDRLKSSLNCPRTDNLTLEFLHFQENECPDVYKEFPLLHLYLHNINSIFIAKNINNLKIPNNIINVINLKERTDRMGMILKYNFTKFEIKRRDAFKARVGVGWEGCARSHVDLVIEAKKQGLPYVIIAEDDFINTIHLREWEDRLISILSWLNNNKDWEIFNGLPTGMLVDSPAKILNRGLGLINMSGGFNTHFIIYNETSYDKVIKWYDYYDIDGLRFKGEFPDLKNRTFAEIHLLAIDVYLSNNFKMITSIPHLTCSNIDDSDIIGSFRKEELNKKQMQAHFLFQSQKLRHFFDSYQFLLKTELLFGNRLYSENSEVTLVCTSCNRWSQLYLTISTFMKYNSFSLKNIIITEDSGNERMAKLIQEYFPFVELIYDGKRRGQFARIKEAWSRVDTKYVFHIEDDWEFLHPFFIEQSKKLLDTESSILNVWLRDIDDTNLHPINKTLLTSNKIYFWKLELNYNGEWHGFTWNPTLMNHKIIYEQLLKVGNVDKSGNNDNGLMVEIDIGNKCKELGLTSAIIPGGYVRHTGEFSTLNEKTKEHF